MYHVVGTGLIAILLYLISYTYYRLGYYSRLFHRKLWNSILAVAFIVTALAGIFMALQWIASAVLMNVADQPESATPIAAFRLMVRGVEISAQMVKFKTVYRLTARAYINGIDRGA